MDEQIEKIKQLIPQGQSVQKVWHKEKDAIKRSFEKRISFRPEGIEFDTEKRIMQISVSISGRSRLLH